ncbi:UDP-glucose 4-epimerase [Sesbania bispinosa]|nr:UDP-glucose 4-epimerase [Sesbania bispinosa]
MEVIKGTKNLTFIKRSKRPRPKVKFIPKNVVEANVAWWNQNIINVPTPKNTPVVKVTRKNSIASTSMQNVRKVTDGQ